MCGICGYIKTSGSGNEPDHSLIKRMSDTLIHRGPDDEGVYIDRGYAGLGHRRLSIIDVSGGHQPMTSSDGRFTIVYNGECYNFESLKDELLEKGIVFHSRCDTEVVLQLYRMYGNGCVKYMRGFFAFAVWDNEKKTLFLARDRMGQKPLYYKNDSRGFYFASEIKSIIVGDDRFTPSIDNEALQYYFTYQYIPPPFTIYPDIRKLPPASTLLLTKDGNIHQEIYWHPAFDTKTDISFEDAKTELMRILKEAVKLRMISDVPLGAFLSGGIDSSITVALMSELSSSPVKTFSIGFTHETYNELPYARQVVEKYNTEHNEFIVEPKAMEILPKLVWHYDEPYSDSSAIPTYYVSRETRKYVTVALSGDGGDESFAGYARYKGFLISLLINRLIPGNILEGIGNTARNLPISYGKKKNTMHLIRRFFESFHSSLLQSYQELVGIFSQEVIHTMLKSSEKNYDTLQYIRGFYDKFSVGNPLNKLLSMDIMTYLSGCLLTKVDVASMAVSLETRSPFLDHKVIDFAASLPDNYKLNLFRSKWILKSMFKNILPDDILFRRKMGFGVPIMEWFRGDLKPMLEESLSRKNLSKHNLFNESVVRRLMKEHFSGYRNHCYRLWSLLIFQLWYDTYIEKHCSF